jgi:hypothetical protein
VVKEGRQKKGLGRDIFHHFSYKDRTKKLSPHSLSEVILDVIFTGHRNQSTAALQEAYTAVKSKITDLLAASSLAASVDNLTPNIPYPYLLSLAGIDLECLNSYADCASFLR